MKTDWENYGYRLFSTPTVLASSYILGEPACCVLAYYELVDTMHTK